MNLIVDASYNDFYNQCFGNHMSRFIRMGELENKVKFFFYKLPEKFKFVPH